MAVHEKKRLAPSVHLVVVCAYVLFVRSCKVARVTARTCLRVEIILGEVVMYAGDEVVEELVCLQHPLVLGYVLHLGERP